MEKILVPCDFSDQALSAFRLAAEWSRRSNGVVHMLHVIALPVMHDSMLMPTLSFEADLLKELTDQAEERFNNLSASVSSDVNVVTKVIFGDTAMMILDYLNEIEADLVIMGTKGVSGLRELLIGSNAEKIVRSASCPVITVRNDCTLDKIKHIVFPNDLTEHQDDLVQHVKVLQDFFKATLHIVWINTPGNFTADATNKIRLNDFAGRHMFKDFTLQVYNDTTEEAGVINFAHTMKTDLIVMGTHGRKGLSHMLSGSVAEDVVNHIDCPIWTYAISTTV